MRNAAQWADVPIEFVAALPPAAYDELWTRIGHLDPWVVQARKPERD